MLYAIVFNLEAFKINVRTYRNLQLIFIFLNL